METGAYLIPDASGDDNKINSHFHLSFIFELGTGIIFSLNFSSTVSI
jgi:hypothetical protein